MGIKQKAFQPLPHGHTIDNVIDLQSRLNDTQFEQNGAVDRRYQPFCRALVNSNFVANNATDMILGASAIRTHDNASMLKVAGEAGAGDTARLRVIIPIAGFYRIHWRFYIENMGSSVPSGFVTLNGTNVLNNSLVNAQGSSNGWGGGAVTETTYLAQGDILYFGLWQGSGSNKTVFATWFNGSRSGLSVEWVCR